MTLLIAMLMAQSCEPATATQTGCVTPNTQHLFGFKYLEDGMCSMSDAFFNGAVRAYPGKQMRLLGSRPDGDEAAAVVAANEVHRTTGNAFEVRNGPEHSDSILEVVNATRQLSLSCSQFTPQNECNIVDNVSYSGHLAMSRAPGHYLATGDYLGLNHGGMLVDGGRPNPADYPPGVVGTEPDGGTFFEYAGNHGGRTHIAMACRADGLLDDLRNNCSGGGDDRVYFVHKSGGIGQHHGLSRWQFPACPETLILTSQGQYVYGARGSMLLYAEDDMHWHACTPGGWRMLKFSEDD